MQWTTRSFLHKVQEWQERYEDPNVAPGPKAYAARQAAQWNSMATEADQLFRLRNSEYRSVTTLSQ